MKKQNFWNNIYELNIFKIVIYELILLPTVSLCNGCYETSCYEPEFMKHGGFQISVEKKTQIESHELQISSISNTNNMLSFDAPTW